MKKMENENVELVVGLYDDYLDNQMKINIGNYVDYLLLEIRNLGANNEYLQMKLKDFLLKDFDKFFENLKSKLHIEVPVELEQDFESEIIENLKYWYGNRTIWEHFYVFDCSGGPILDENEDSKIKIICPIHGMFEQYPDSHLNGVGCPKCAGAE